MRIQPLFYEEEGGKLPGREMEHAKSPKKRARPSGGWQHDCSDSLGGRGEDRCQRRLGRWVTEDIVHPGFFSDSVQGALTSHTKGSKLGCDIVVTRQEFEAFYIY